MGTVHIKGKTLVAGGRYRGKLLAKDKDGKPIDGESIRWTADERTVEVDEANAAAILGDSMLMAIRFDPNAPAAGDGRSPDQFEEELFDRLHAAEAEVERLQREVGRLERELERALELAAAKAAPADKKAKAEAKAKADKPEADKPEA